VSCCSGFPQGSVLGPLLFAVYVSVVEDLIKINGVNRLVYADYTQLFLSLETGLLKIKMVCIKAWFAENELLLDADKSYDLLIGINGQLRAANNISCLKPTTIQYNVIDLRCRNSLFVRLQDRDAGWKRRLFKKPRRTDDIKTTLKKY